MDVAFEPAVLAVLQRLQPGQVVTYGELAEEAGYPGRSRAVGNLLARGVPGAAWWRVVTASGRLVPGLESEHGQRLVAEGIDPDTLGRVMRARRATRVTAARWPR